MSDDVSGDVNEFEQQVVDVFNERGGEGPPDEVSPPSPGDGDEGTAPPDAQTGGVAPDDLSFVEPVTDQPIDVPADTNAEQIGDEPLQPDSAFEDYWGAATDEQLGQARAVYDWYSQLDQNAIAQIDATLSGQYVLVPAQQIEQLQQDWNLVEQVRSGKYQPQNSTDTYDYDDESGQVDPTVAALNDRVAELEMERMQQQQAYQIEQSASTIDHVYEAWKSEHPELDANDFATLEQMVVQSGVFGPLAAQYGDQQATIMALDQMLYVNPGLRDKTLQPLVDQRLQQEMQAVQEQQARGQRASSISGASAEPPGETASTLDPEEAMIEELARALRDNG